MGRIHQRPIGQSQARIGMTRRSGVPRTKATGTDGARRDATISNCQETKTGGRCGRRYKITYHDWGSVYTPNVLWSGQTCVDYSLSGPRTGSNGKTGWMFVEQTRPIIELQPDSVVLEMVANATRINGGREVRMYGDGTTERILPHAPEGTMVMNPTGNACSSLAYTDDWATPSFSGQKVTLLHQ